jgi:hypothetical protein
MVLPERDKAETNELTVLDPGFSTSLCRESSGLFTKH